MTTDTKGRELLMQDEIARAGDTHGKCLGWHAVLDTLREVTGRTSLGKMDESQIEAACRTIRELAAQPSGVGAVVAEVVAEMRAAGAEWCHRWTEVIDWANRLESAAPSIPVAAEMRKHADELERDGVYPCCKETYRHCAAMVESAAAREPQP